MEDSHTFQNIKSMIFKLNITQYAIEILDNTRYFYVCILFLLDLNNHHIYYYIS